MITMEKTGQMLVLLTFCCEWSNVFCDCTMNRFFRTHRLRMSRAALAVLGYFLVQIVVINPVVCLPTGGGANIEMCVLDFQCPCVCDHPHEDGHDTEALWLNPCKICLDIPISLGNDLMPDNNSPQERGGVIDMAVVVQDEATVPFIPVAFRHPRDYRPPGIPPNLLFCVQLC